MSAQLLVLSRRVLTHSKTTHKVYTVVTFHSIKPGTHWRQSRKNVRHLGDIVDRIGDSRPYRRQSQPSWRQCQLRQDVEFKLLPICRQTGDKVDHIGNKVDRVSNSLLCCWFVAGFCDSRLCWWFVAGFSKSRLCCWFVAGFGNSRLCRQCVPGLTVMLYISQWCESNVHVTNSMWLWR